jgi:hypothetical protein
MQVGTSNFVLLKVKSEHMLHNRAEYAHRPPEHS